LLQKLKGEIAEAERELDVLADRQKQLKSALYAKFGDRINLDE
jgi:hypothetical protein